MSVVPPLPSQGRSWGWGGGGGHQAISSLRFSLHSAALNENWVCTLWREGGRAKCRLGGFRIWVILCHLTKTSAHDRFQTPGCNGILQVGWGPGAGPWTQPEPRMWERFWERKGTYTVLMTRETGTSVCLLLCSLFVWTPVSQGKTGGWRAGC